MGPIEYRVTPVRDFLGGTELRHVADGVPLAEIRGAALRVGDWGGWVDHWLDRCRTLTGMAEAAPTRASRAELMVTASLCAHLGQYLHFNDVEEKRTALAAKVTTYRDALESMAHRAEAVQVPFGSGTLPAVMHVPGVVDPPPCVVVVGGLDSHKEDSHAFVALCLARGLAVLALDGPGQGEAMMLGVPFAPGAHRAISAAIDHLETRRDIDAARVGVIGRSLGGFLAPRAAADDHRARAMVVWAAMYDLSVLPTFPAHTLAGFRHITGAADLADTIERLRWVDLAGHASRIDIPTLIVHGAEDRLIPPAHAERLAAEIGAACDLRIIAGSEHCNHDQAHVVRPMMADWLAVQLG